MNTRLSSMAVLFDDSALDLAPKPTEKVVRFADTPVEMAANLGAFRIPSLDEAPKQPETGRHYH